MDQGLRKSYHTRLRIIPVGDFFNLGQDVDLDGVAKVRSVGVGISTISLKFF